MDKKEFTIHKAKQSQLDKLMDARDRMINQVKDKNHRLEEVRELDGILFVNDSSATSIYQAKDSIRCIKNPIIWILEGTDYDRDFILLNKITKYKVEAIVAYGIDTEDAARDLAVSVDSFVHTSTLETAVKEAYKLGSEGYVVLFSPTCPVKKYSGFAERGLHFKDLVNKL